MKSVPTAIWFLGTRAIIDNPATIANKPDINVRSHCLFRKKITKPSYKISPSKLCNSHIKKLLQIQVECYFQKQGRAAMEEHAPLACGESSETA
jgi:hypothetical protein